MPAISTDQRPLKTWLIKNPAIAEKIDRTIAESSDRNNLLRFFACSIKLSFSAKKLSGSGV
jgi:hypothetical protein